MILTRETTAAGALLVKMQCRMDIQGADAVDLPFAAALANQTGPVVVDMSGVSYMASVGVRTFLLNAKALHGRGGRMILAAPNPNVRTVLEALGVHTLLPIEPTVEAALAGVSA